MGEGAGKFAWGGIVVAALGAIGVVIAAMAQWRADVEVEQQRIEAQLKLEERRFRSRLIILALEQESERDRRDFLTFLGRVGLVDGLDAVLEEGSFLPRAGVSFTEVSSLLAQQGLRPESFPSAPPLPGVRLPALNLGTPARRLMAVALTPDGRNPTADQRVAEAVRLALEGAPQDRNRANMLLAEAGYPDGFSLEVSAAAYLQVGGSEQEVAASARALGAIGIAIHLAP